LTIGNNKTNTQNKSFLFIKQTYLYEPNGMKVFGQLVTLGFGRIFRDKEQVQILVPPFPLFIEIEVYRAVSVFQQPHAYRYFHLIGLVYGWLEKKLSTRLTVSTFFWSTILA